jgi:hypothetical protein
VPLFFSIIPKHVDGFVSTWHEFKNSVTVEVGILPLKPLAGSNFHFLIISE